MSAKVDKWLQKRANVSKNQHDITPSKGLPWLLAVVEAELLTGMLLAADVLAADRCRANMAYARPAYGRGFQVQDFETVTVLAF